MKVRIYVEGSGDKADGKRKIREGFGQFFRKALGNTSPPLNVIACGGRDATFRDFKNGLDSHPDAFVILLVDSEAQIVENTSPWDHLKKRDPSWIKPESVSNDQLHLMVQTMEAWFIADRQTLKAYYGHSFNENPIPKNNNIEDVDKAQLEPALKEASKNTTKGAYHKINHGPEILGKVDPRKVSKASKHCERLLDKLTEMLK